MLELIKSELFLLFLKNQFLPLKLVLEFLSFSFQSSYFLVSFFFYISPLVLKLLNFFLKLLNSLLTHLLMLWFFLLQFILNLSNFLFLYDVLLMQFPDLLFLVVDLFDLLFGFLTQLLQFLLHSCDFIRCLFVFIIFQSFLLSFSDLF